MFKKRFYSFLTIVLFLSLSTYAHHIVWISETNANTDLIYFDQGWVDLLEDARYTVDFRPGEWMILDADELVTLESADLIIVSRNSNSGNYATDVTEVIQWNSVPTPLILMSAYWCRNSRWLWINNMAIDEYAHEVMMQVVDSTHPVFEGIKPVGGLVDVIDETVNSGQNTFILTNDVGNGILLAQREDNQAVWVAEWSSGVEFYDGSGQIPAEKRMLFIAGGGGDQEAGSLNLNNDGIKMFLNAVRYMIGGDPLKAFGPDPVDGVIYEDTWVNLSWGAGDHAASHDVYFGKSFVDVEAGTGDTFQGNQLSTSFVVGLPGHPYPDGLKPDTTYYWRIDEIETNGTTIHKGDVWSFTVVDEVTVEFQVSSSEEDGYAVNEGFQNLNSDYLRVGRGGFSEPPYYMCGMVFRNVDIPQGAAIISAHLMIRSYDSHLADIVYGKIEAEATDSAEPFGNFRNIGALSRTSTSVNWDHFDPWIENTWYKSPNIANVIQEVVNRNGWFATSNSLAILYGTRESEGGYRHICSYESGREYAPKLKITYVP